MRKRGGVMSHGGWHGERVLTSAIILIGLPLEVSAGKDSKYQPGTASAVGNITPSLPLNLSPPLHLFILLYAPDFTLSPAGSASALHFSPYSPLSLPPTHPSIPE